jgi:hypothetical protein
MQFINDTPLFVGIENAAAIITTDFIAHLSIEMIRMSIGMSFVSDDGPEIKMTHSIVKISKCERKRRRQRYRLGEQVKYKYLIFNIWRGAAGLEA